MAESFVTAAPSALGRLELSWFTGSLSSKNGAFDKKLDAKPNGTDLGDPDLSSDQLMPDVADSTMSKRLAKRVDQEIEPGDLDVAEDEEQDDDRWMK